MSEKKDFNVCEHCGSRILDNFKTCPHCGEKNPKSSIVWPIALVFLGFIGCGLLVFGLFFDPVLQYYEDGIYFLCGAGFLIFLFVIGIGVYSMLAALCPARFLSQISKCAHKKIKGCLCAECGKEFHDWDICKCKKCDESHPNASKHDWEHIENMVTYQSEWEEWAGSYSYEVDESYDKCSHCGKTK